MFSVEEQEKAKGRIAAEIFKSTGIKIDAADIEIIVKPKTILLQAWDCDFMRIRKQLAVAANSVSSIVEALSNKNKSLLRRIIRCKISQLEATKKDWEFELKLSLAQKMVSQSFITELELKVVDRGYKYNYYSGRKESAYDYPYLALELNSTCGFRYSFPINVYDEHDPVDIESLKNEVFISVLEWALSQEKELDEL